MILRVLLAVAATAVVAASCGGSGKGVFSSRSSSAASTQSAVVVRDVDGDTIKVKLPDGTEHSVRLIGIDTPETHKPGVKVECGGPEASALAARLAPAGAPIKLASDPTQDKVDRYGRILAYASVNGRGIQLAQLRAGWAEVYVYRGKPFQRVDSFKKASAVAKKHARGVWGKCSGDFHSNQPTS